MQGVADRAQADLAVAYGHRLFACKRIAQLAFRIIVAIVKIVGEMIVSELYGRSYWTWTEPPEGLLERGYSLTVS